MEGRIDFYLTQMNKYGLPLGCRRNYTDSPTYMHFKARSVAEGYFMKLFDMKFNR